VIHATPKHKRIEYAKRIAAVKRERGTDSGLPEWARNPGLKTYHVLRDGRVVFSSDDYLEVSEYAQDLKRIAESAKIEIATRVRGKANRGRKNPAAASAQVYEEFHGFPPSEVVKVTQKVHHHRHLAAAGDLVGLEVKPVSGGPKRKIEGLGDALLAFNEKKNQLFIRGGDQRMSWAELKKFGATEEHELQTIGKLVGIGYFTNKTHLGDEGGEAIYSHKFRTTNENGTHVTVTIARYPDLIYRVLDEQFEISGGSYTIEREGIDK
jgi:hypothetical protein